MKVYHVGSVFVLSLALLVPVAGQETQPRGKPATPPHAQAIQDDGDFVAMMLMHHQRGIELSRGEIERGQSDQVKQLAQKILEGQQKESEELEGFKQQLGERAEGGAQMPRHRDPEAVKGMSERMKAQMAKFRDASGPEVDKTFVAMMTRHHQGSVEMGQAALPKLKLPELRAFVERMIENQKKEIEELKAAK